MRSIWKTFEEKEEEKPFGWESRTRGIGVLPEKKEKSPIWDTFKAKTDVGVGVKAAGSATFGEPEPKSLPLSQTGFEGRMRGIGEAPKEYSLEGITTELSEVTKKRNSLWWNEIKATDDKWKFLRQENWSPELQQADLETQRLSEEASKLGVNINDWIQYGVYTAFFTTMAASILPIVKGLPANLLNKLKYKVEGKTVKGKELLEVLRRITYPGSRSGFGEPSVFDRKVFDEFVKQGGLRGIGKNLKTGVTVTEVTPRFAFGTKLYAGLPADEIVNSIVKVGKVTSDISRELSLAKPKLVSQVIQNLSIASPVIASKLAPELVKLIPQTEEFKKVEPEIEEEIPKELKPLAEEAIITPDTIPYVPEIKFKGKLTNDKLKDTLQKKGTEQGNIISVDGKKVATIGKIVPSKEWSDKEQKFIESERLVDVDIIGKTKHLTTLYNVKLPTQATAKPTEEDDYKLIDKWIKANIPKVSVSGHGGLKEVSKLIREGNVPDDVAEAMRRQFDKTTDQETGEILWWDDEAYPRTGTLMDFYNAYENLDIIAKPTPAPKAIPKELEPLAEEARKYKKPTYYVKSPTREGGIYYTIGGEKELQKRLNEIEGLRERYITKFGYTNEKFNKFKSDKIKDIGVYGTKKPQVKVKLKDIPVMDYSLEDEIIKEYGETDIPERGAFITSDGRFVDGGGTRYTDHREMVPDDLQEYMNVTQNVRIVNAGIKDAETQTNIDIVYRPTEEQVSAIKALVEGKKIYADISGFDGSKIASGEFDNFNDWYVWAKQHTHSPDFYNQATAKPAGEGKYLYHGTSEGAFRNIREEGITGEKEKYFADTEKYAETYAKRKGSDRILRVKKTPDFVEDKNIPEGGDFKTLENIPPENIEIKIGDKWIPIQEYADIDKNIIPVRPTEPKAVAKPEPTKAEPKPELATPAQINKSYAIAKSKAMISDLGKVKPQYRKVAEVMTGKKHIEDMTPEQAEMFIDALNRLPEPKYKNGKLVAPSIPRTTKLTTEGFFQKKYNEPTPIWLLTDQTYYAEKLGIKPLVEPFERGKQEFDLEFRRSSNLADRVVNKLNKIAKTPMGDRLKSKVKNIPTKAESKMAELLNKHEATPSGLSDKEADVFKYFRNLSKDIWRRENEVREKVDLPPIKYKTAYFRHTADAMAKEMLEGKYPFPQGIKYWSEKMVGKKIFNPMEFQRKLSDDLIDIWSKDLRAVTKAMLWNGLKEIHLAEPAKFLNEQLNAISKDLPEYKNLTPREQAAYKQTQVMPASTKKWLIDYINQVIKGQETETDASLNRIVTKSGLKGIFDKVLSPFGRAVGRKPITNIFSLSGRMVISGVMGWVPRQMIRNAFQQVQNLALYGVKATIKSFLPAGIDKNLKGLLTESLFLKSYTGFEELPADLMGKLEKVWLYPYGVVANNNAKQGMKAAYWNILELIKNPKFKKYGWADPQRTKDTPKGHLYPGEKEKLSKEMEFGASCTQYQYIPIGMPGVFRFKALIPFSRLQSWWMNYFTKFNREAIHRGLKGRPSWSGEDGPTLPWSRRVNWLKYVIIGGAVLIALGYKKSFMWGVAPTYLSPAGQLVLGFYNYATANEDRKRKKALKQIYYSWKAFIPGSLAWRDFIAVWNGEKDLEEILFYGKKKAETKAIPKSNIWAKVEGSKKSTKSDIWGTFDTEKKSKSTVWATFD